MSDWAAVLKPAVRPLLERLLQGPASLSELSAASGISRQAAHEHMAGLVALGVASKEEVRTATGREVRYELRPASLHLELRPQAKAVIAWASAGHLDPAFPLTAQIPQEDLRNEVASALALIARSYGAGFPDDVPFVVLFGSVARGEATWKSDIDLMFVTSPAGNEERLRDAAAGAQEHTQHPIRVHVTAPEDLLAGRRLIEREALESGLIIHAKEETDPLWARMDRYKRISL
jgi:predicted nucleotidyltransferase